MITAAASLLSRWGIESWERMLEIQKPGSACGPLTTREPLNVKSTLQAQQTRGPSQSVI